MATGLRRFVVLVENPGASDTWREELERLALAVRACSLDQIHAHLPAPRVPVTIIVSAAVVTALEDALEELRDLRRFGEVIAVVPDRRPLLLWRLLSAGMAVAVEGAESAALVAAGLAQREKPKRKQSKH